MIDGLKPYPKYKESGLLWVGMLPRHWDTGPGFASFRQKRFKNLGMQERKVLSLSYGRIVVKPPEKLHGLVPQSFETYQIVEPGDIIVRSTDLQNDWTSLRVGLVRERGIITSAYLCLKTTGALMPEYGYLLLHAFDLMKVFYGLGSGLRQNLDFSDFKRMLIFLPPFDEQAAIVKFIDHAIRSLNRAIRAKQKVIALLNEQKQVIIHRAMTRGINPNVPLKPSSIPWLGEIPRHWKVIPLKFLSLRIQNGATPPTAEQRYYYNGTVPWYGPSSIGTNTHVGNPVRYLAQAAFDQGKARLVKGPAVLVIVIGATAGKMALLDGEGATNQQMTAFELEQERIAPQFCIHQLRLSENWLRSTASTATIPILDSGIVTRLPVAFPLIDEQQAVLRYLQDETHPSNLAMSHTERQITLLKEYRTRLIADVVTGKLDVREAASRLPDEGEIDEPVIDEKASVEEEVLESEAMGEDNE